MENSMNTKALVLGAAMLATTPAMAQTYGLKQAVSVCLAWVQHEDPYFDAYVPNDGAGYHVKELGTPRAVFLFDHCMDNLGHTLGTGR
jgi:hypothetical protein